MKIKRKILILLNSEKNILFKNLKKEINFIFSLSIKDYFINLVFPKNYNYILILFRIITLYIVLRLIFDFLVFIFKIIFNFYFIIIDRIFEIIKQLNVLFFENWFFFQFNLKVIKFFRYIFLFMFFVNISEDLKKKKIPLWVYILEFLADIIIYIIRKQINWRYILYPILKIIQLIILLLQIVFNIIALFIDFFIILSYKYFRKFILVRIIGLYKYFRIVLKYNSKGKFYINNIFLFHVSNELKKNGFIAPKCEDNIIWLKAKLDYKRYRRKYIRSELTPDIIDSKSLNIYIYLKSLLKETRYQRKLIGFFDILVVLFPFNIIIYLYFFLIYTFMGVVYMICLLLFPIIFLYVGLRILYIIYDLFFFIYCLCFKDITTYLIKVRERQVYNKKIKEQIDKNLSIIFEFLKKIIKGIKKFFNFLNKLFKGIIKIFKKFFNFLNKL